MDVKDSSDLIKPGSFWGACHRPDGGFAIKLYHPDYVDDAVPKSLYYNVIYWLENDQVFRLCPGFPIESEPNGVSWFSVRTAWNKAISQKTRSLAISYEN